MERRSFLAGAAGAIAGAGVPGAPAIAAQPSVRWRLASSFPRNLDTIFGGAEFIARQVSLMSGGRFEISTHAAGEIAPPLALVDAVQQGSIDCAHTAPYYYFGKDETFALGCAIPFGLNSRQESAWMYHGNGLKLMREFYRNYNIHSFPAGNTGAQMGGWFRKEIHGLADFKGLKFRIGGFGGRIIERLGGVPQNIAGGDIYAALEKGTIDAAEWVGPYDDLRLGFHKIAPHYYYPAFWEGGAQLDLFVNVKAWEALPADFQAMLETACAAAHVHMQAKYDAVNPPALRELYANGTKLHAFPKDFMDAAFATSMQYYSELSAKNPGWKKVYADYRNFQREENLWFRFAEMGYDDFMQAQKL
jgi:TRAP-type mannitol/chloroaromatic compound transport system substrate-binding protein